MANEWFVPTDFYYIADMANKWTKAFKGRTLSQELGFDVNTVSGGAPYGNMLSTWTANGWQRPFFDGFDGTPVGQCPANVVDERTDKTLSQPEWWWSYGRGPTGSGSPVTPTFTRPDMTTNQYQILQPSVLGIGAVRVPTATIGGVTYPGKYLTGSMSTQRRGPTTVPAEDPGTWSYTDNLAYSQSYGYFEGCSRSQRYRGAWPGHWLVSDDEWYSNMFPRIELDIVEMYLSASSEDGVVHNTPWLHRPNGASWIAPGYQIFDRGWSSNSSGVSTKIYYPDGVTLKKWDDGFHTFGMYIKKDLTAPNGLGWMIWYVDRVETARIPLIMEWLRYYYFLVSNQSQTPYQNESSTAPGANPAYNYMDSFKQYWFEVDHIAMYRNPSVVDPPRLIPYIPPTLTDPIKTVSISRLERQMSAKADTLVAGSILTPEHSNTNIPPIMAQSARFIMIQGATAGTAVGTVAVTNSPTNPVKYRLAGTDRTDFAVNQATGAITVATGKTLSTLKQYRLKMIASDFPLTPPSGLSPTNVTFISIDVREDATFGFKYWRRESTPYPRGEAFPKLRWWLDAQDSSTYDIDTGKVVMIRDKSGRDVYRAQTDLTKCPVLNATGIGGHPAWESQDVNVMMTGPEVLSASWFLSIYLRASGALSMGQGGGTGNSLYDFVNPTIFFMAWTADPTVDPDVVLTSVNGTVVVPISTAPTNKTVTIAAACVFKADALNAANIGTIHSGFGLFNDQSAPTRWFDGKIGEIGVMYWPNNEGITTELHEKLVGGLAHKWSLTSLLPSDHTYKTTVPKLWA